MIRRQFLCVLAALLPLTASATLPFSTFLGGSSNDDIAVVVAANGSVYVAGSTSSSTFPATTLGYDTTANGGSDAFIARFDPGLSNLLAATFFGGSGDDGIRALIVDGAGRVTVAGFTQSANFPTSSGAADTTHNGASDAFVAKFDANLSTLIGSTFVGGSDVDDAYALAKDSASNVYVAGLTASANFPTAGGPLDTTLGGAQDAFVAKLNDNLTSVLASTYLGGNGNDSVFAMLWDPAGQLVLAGDTASTNFPVSVGAFHTTRSSANDLFATRMATDLASVPSSTYVGPADNIGAAGVGIDSSRRVYVATRTSAGGYPVLAGFDATPNGGGDIGVSLLSSDLSSLVASTLIGGSGDDSLYSLVVEPNGNVCVAGTSNSPDYPVTPGVVDGNYVGSVANSDVIVSRLNPLLSALVGSTCIRGNSGSDTAHGLASDGAGNVFVGGTAASADFPVTPFAFDSTFNGGADGFVAKLSWQTDNTQGADYDGDGRTDLAVYDIAHATWYLQRTKDGFTQFTFGFSGVIPVIGDYDGDGRLDTAVYAPSSGTWFMLQSSAGFKTVQFGFAGVVPVPADYDGDGRTDLAVYDPIGGTWYVLRTTAGFLVAQFGFSSVVPVPADYDEDGRADLAVFDRNAGNWYLLRSTAGFSITQFGFGGVTPVPADYDGDGQVDIGVFYKPQAQWYISQSHAGFKNLQFGVGSVVPVPADYDGDGHADISVYDVSTGYWKLFESHAGSVAPQFGFNGAVPVLGQYWINRSFGFP